MVKKLLETLKVGQKLRLAYDMDTYCDIPCVVIALNPDKEETWIRHANEPDELPRASYLRESLEVHDWGFIFGQVELHSNGRRGKLVYEFVTENG